MANSKLEKSLGLIRKKIDLIDDQMLSLLEDRVSLVIDAENLKKNTSKGPFYRPDREKEIIRRLQSLNNSPLEDIKSKQFFRILYRPVFQQHLKLRLHIWGLKVHFQKKLQKNISGLLQILFPADLSEKL